MENKTLVLYKTKYGSTKRYAEWIAQKSGADIADLTGFDKSRLKDYDIIVFGSSVHVGKIKHIDFFKDNWETLKNKKVVIFTSSGAPPDDPAQKATFESSLPQDIREKVAYFPLQGDYDYKNLDFTDKLLMHGPGTALLLKWILGGDKKAKEDYAKLKTKQEWAKEEAVEPIVSYIRS